MKLQRNNKYSGKKILTTLSMTILTSTLLMGCSSVHAEEAPVLPQITPTLSAETTPIPVITSTLTATIVPTATPLAGISELGVLDENKSNTVNVNDIKVLRYFVDNKEYISFVKVNRLPSDFEYRNIFTDEVLFTSYVTDELGLIATKREFRDKEIDNFKTEISDLEEYAKTFNEVPTFNKVISYEELEKLYKKNISRKNWIDTDLELYLPLTDEEKSAIERLNIKSPNSTLYNGECFALVFLLDGETKISFVSLGLTEAVDIFSKETFLITSLTPNTVPGKVNIPSELTTQDKKEVTLIYFNSIGMIEEAIPNCKVSKFSSTMDKYNGSPNSGREWKLSEFAEYYVEIVPEENRFYVSEYMKETTVKQK